MTKQDLTVVIGGSGKTGRRVTRRLEALGLAVRAVSRSTATAFDWEDDRTWSEALAGATRMYLTYHPDLAMPTAAEQVRRLMAVAADAGVRKVVLLAGRGEPQVHAAEAAVRQSGLDWTILECAFFMQNFTEGALAASDGKVYFPADTAVLEPFVDCDDIADVAVQALLGDIHNRRIYDLTGPELLRFPDAVDALSAGTRTPLTYVQLDYERYAEVLREHMDPPAVSFLTELFRFLLDGHNARLSSDIEYVLGRPARRLEDFARAASRTAA